MTAASGAATKPKLRMERKLAAPPARVYRAWTTPDEIKAWWGKRVGFAVEEAVFELRVGGRFRLAMRSPENSRHVVNGTIREIVPNRRIVHSWAWEGNDMPGPETLVTVDFLADGTGTRLVLTHENFATEDACQKHEDGWNRMTEAFDEHCTGS